MIRTDLAGDTPTTMRLSWRIDQKAQAELEEEIFGKRILVTDHTTGPSNRSSTPTGPRRTSKPGSAKPKTRTWCPSPRSATSPTTRSASTCVLALSLAHLMRRECARAGLSLSVPALLAELEGIGETVLLYQGERGRPRARHTITKMTPTQEHLYKTFDLATYAPHR